MSKNKYDLIDSLNDVLQVIGLLAEGETNEEKVSKIYAVQDSVAEIMFKVIEKM